MSIAIWILLVAGATGEAQRSMVVEQDVAGIILRVGIGAISDVLTRDGTGLRGSRGILSRAERIFDGAKLTIDGEPRTGWRAWIAAGSRVCAYAADCRHSGSVEYAYTLAVRQYSVRRHTEIRDGLVTLTTDIWWTERVEIGRLTREIPIHVRLTINAVERVGDTVLRGDVIGTADTDDFRCDLVRRIAERQAAATLDRELPRVLRAIEQRGRSWYAAGEMPSIVSSIGDGIRAIGRLRQ